MNALHHNAAAASTLALSSGGDVAAQRFPASNLAVRPQRAAAHIAIRKIGEDVPTNDAVLWSPRNEAKAQPTSNCSEN